MPISESDVKLKLSTLSGTAGNQFSQPNTRNSLGRYISTTEVVGGALNAVFDDITGDENAAQTVDYRCVFIHNANATSQFRNIRVWISSAVEGGADVEIGLDGTSASAIGSTSAQAAQVVNETTAPAGITFSAPTTKNDGLNLGDLNAGQCRAIWIKRSAKDTPPKNNDGVTIRIQGDSGE